MAQVGSAQGGGGTGQGSARLRSGCVGAASRQWLVAAAAAQGSWAKPGLTDNGSGGVGEKK